MLTPSFKHFLFKHAHPTTPTRRCFAAVKSGETLAKAAASAVASVAGASTPLENSSPEVAFPRLRSKDDQSPPSNDTRAPPQPPHPLHSQHRLTDVGPNHPDAAAASASRCPGAAAATAIQSHCACRLPYPFSSSSDTQGGSFALPPPPPPAHLSLRDCGSKYQCCRTEGANPPRVFSSPMRKPNALVDDDARTTSYDAQGSDVRRKVSVDSEGSRRETNPEEVSYEDVLASPRDLMLHRLHWAPHHHPHTQHPHQHHFHQRDMHHHDPGCPLRRSDSVNKRRRCRASVESATAASTSSTTAAAPEVDYVRVEGDSSRVLFSKGQQSPSSGSDDLAADGRDEDGRGCDGRDPATFAEAAAQTFSSSSSPPNSVHCRMGSGNDVNDDGDHVVDNDAGGAAIAQIRVS